MLFRSDHKNRFLLFPNPAENSVACKFDKGIHSVSVYNVLGEMLIHEEYAMIRPEAILDIERLPEGIYTAEINSDAARERSVFIKSQKRNN